MKKRVLFLGRFPPPIYGTSLMNENYYNSKVLNNSFELKRIRMNVAKEISSKERKNLHKIISGLINIKRIVSRLLEKPDLVYFDVTSRGIAFVRDSIYLMIIKLFGIKILVQFHSKGLKNETKNKIKRDYYKLTFRNTKAILLSELLYEDVDNLMSKNNVYFNPNGIEDVLTEKEFLGIQKNRKRKRKVRLIFLSNMLEAKGPMDVLKICKLLHRDKIDFECFFVGDWEDEKVKNKWYDYLKDSGLQNKCKFVGPRYGEEKFSFLKEVDFLIFPTKYALECYPLVILEAFMFGIPVYTYDNGAIREIINRDYLGHIAKQGDYQDLYEELKKNINKPQKNKEIREYFKEKYIFDKAEERLKDIFERELSGAREDVF